MVQFASYLRRVLCKTRLIFPRINGPIMASKASRERTRERFLSRAALASMDLFTHTAAILN